MRSFIWTFVSTLLSLGLLLAVVLLVKTFATGPQVVHGPDCQDLDVDYIQAGIDVIKRFQKAISIKTVSWNKEELSTGELEKLVLFIQSAYPLVHSHPTVTFQKVNKYSLLYKIQGNNTKLKPYMLCAHLDVVPIGDQQWEFPAFSGHIHDGYIYGRGTIDNKQSVMGILEALTFLLKSGYQPNRTFYVAFGHDEEVTGLQGAKMINDVLMKQGVQLEYLMDEGFTVTEGIYPGVSKIVAGIGTSEKGYMTIELSVNMSAGHSSMPEKESAIGILASAVSRLEAHPHPVLFGTGPERGTFEQLAPEMNIILRILMSNIWLFKYLIASALSDKPSANAMMRTTTAITMFNAGFKHNVISASATAIVNHRVHPSESLKQVLEFDKHVIADDRVQIKVLDAADPLPLSSYDENSFGYNTIKSSIKQIWGKNKVVVVPGLLIGNTDTKHYLNLTDNIYRFSPSYMRPDDLQRFHGLNERISIKNYEQAINFFYHLILNSDKDKLDFVHSHTGEL